jgi:WD40 repeat protein
LENEDLLITASDDNKIKLTNWKTKYIIQEFSHHTKIPTGLIISTKEDILISSGHDNQIFFIDMKNGNILF